MIPGAGGVSIIKHGEDFFGSRDHFSQGLCRAVGLFGQWFEKSVVNADLP